MKSFAIAAVLTLMASPSVAQANANLAPGGIADGSRATINDAEGTAPDGRPAPGGRAAPGGRQGEGRQSATDGSKMVKQGDSGTRPPTEAETPNKP